MFFSDALMSPEAGRCSPRGCAAPFGAAKLRKFFDNYIFPTIFSANFMYMSPTTLLIKQSVDYLLFFAVSNS